MLNKWPSTLVPLVCICPISSKPFLSMYLNKCHLHITGNTHCCFVWKRWLKVSSLQMSVYLNSIRQCFVLIKWKRTSQKSTAPLKDFEKFTIPVNIFFYGPKWLTPFHETMDSSSELIQREQVSCIKPVEFWKTFVRFNVTTSHSLNSVQY